MTTTTEKPGVNAGTAPAEALVEATFPMPQWLWDAICQESRAEQITTEEIAEQALRDHFEFRKATREIEEGTELPAEDLIPLMGKAAVAAVRDHVALAGEITVPLKLAVVPAGTLPVFLHERTVRNVRECCEIANVDADEWVEGWIGVAQVDAGLNGENDVDLTGICVDLVEEHGERTDAEKEELYDKFREVAFRYQQELKQEADASKEGGEA